MRIKSRVVLCLSLVFRLLSSLFQAVIASGFHLFPFRTEKLSPSAPMVLRKWESRSPPFLRSPFRTGADSFFVFGLLWRSVSSINNGYSVYCDIGIVG